VLFLQQLLHCRAQAAPSNYDVFVTRRRSLRDGLSSVATACRLPPRVLSIALVLSARSLGPFSLVVSVLSRLEVQGAGSEERRRSNRPIASSINPNQQNSLLDLGLWLNQVMSFRWKKIRQRRVFASWRGQLASQIVVGRCSPWRL
jgi:hypothetical protein